MEDSSKKSRDYEVDVVDFFKAENYYNNLINSFSYSTTISPDTSEVESNFETIYRPFDLEKLNKLSEMYDIDTQKLILSIFMFNLTKFSFSKTFLWLIIIKLQDIISTLIYQLGSIWMNLNVNLRSLRIIR